jgi:hypothetical protein
VPPVCTPLQVQERRATRGLAAAARLQGQFRPAIKYLERVLEISRDMGEYTGEGWAEGERGSVCGAGYGWAELAGSV